MLVVPLSKVIQDHDFSQFALLKQWLIQSVNIRYFKSLSHNLRPREVLHFEFPLEIYVCLE
jgi:hypothetical protein